MPNPFPGMNPYLENPMDWREVHAALIYCFRTALAAALPAPFQARMEERVYVQETNKDYIADSLVVEKLGPLVRVSETTLPPVHPKVFDAPRHVVFNTIPERERFIEIRSRRDEKAVVAVIEFLSPKNKTPGIGRNDYLRKQSDVLHSNAHLLEIDLLRIGQYSLAPPESELRERLGRFDYLISLHQAHCGAEFDLWPLSLHDRLPRLRLPLAGNETVVVDLQEVLERVYNDGKYDGLVDYSQPPVPPLAPADAIWANELIAKMNADTTGAADSTSIIETKDF